tara:strand:- start:695 stop:910 length:216 start_codon:yes stop_codon:yes gene_type:complete
MSEIEENITDQSIPIAVNKHKRKIVIYPHTKAVFSIAHRWKLICLENHYTWKSMDEDILAEATRFMDESVK